MIKDPDTTEYKVVRVASQAYTKGDAVHRDRTSDAIEVVVATASSNTRNIYGVAMETVTSSATELLVALITPQQTWKVEVANTASANHNGQRMILSDKDSVNNTGTDDTTDEAVFVQEGVVGTTQITGKFLQAATAA